MRLSGPAALTLLLAVCITGVFALAPRVQGTPPPTPRPTPSPAATPGADWKAIDALIGEQKLEAAQQFVEARLTAARGKGDEAEWTRALVRTVQLRIALHGYETAVRFLKDEPWPKGTLARATLDLFYGRTLVIYRQAYAWESASRRCAVTDISRNWFTRSVSAHGHAMATRILRG